MGNITFSAVNLSGIRGRYRLFKSCHFLIQAGTSLHIKGENGTGKTSLLRMLAGLWEPDTGQIYWCGHPIENIKDDFRRSMIFLGHQNNLAPTLSAVDNIKVSWALERNHILTDAQVEHALESLGFNLKEAPCYTLSVGQKRRIALSRLLLSDARLWLLDEPFTGLDTNGVERVKNMMLSHLNKGGMIVYSSHLACDIGSDVYQL